MIAALVLAASLATPSTLTSTMASSSSSSLAPAVALRADPATSVSTTTTPSTTSTTSTLRKVAPPAKKKPVRLAATAVRAPDPDPNAPDHVPTFVEQYLSFALSPQALPEVKNGQVLAHILGYVCFGVCGSLWGPLVATPGAQLTGDVLGTWFLSTLVWFGVSVGFAFTGIGAVLILAWPYFSSVATLNAIDRDLKRRGGSSSSPSSDPRPRPPAATTPTPQETPPPSYAY
jgi:hypothetical protein